MRIAHWVLLAVAGVTVGCAEEPVTAPVEVGSVAEARAEQAKKPASSPSVVEVALQVNAETGEFSTLIAALGAADLVDDLAARGQRTVFAPTDAAFAAIGLDAATVGTLRTEALVDILLYHVAPGRRYAADVTEADRIRMLNGGFNAITVTAEGAFIGDEPAKIIATDIEASNGVIHVINAVLLP